MESVATAAGVTRMTVYNQFGSRLALVDAVLDQVVARDQLDRLVEGTQAMEPDAAIRTAVHTTCRFWETERPLLRRLFAAAYTEPTIDDMLHRREQWRRDQFTALLRRLESHRESDDAQLSAVAHLLTAMTSFPTYDHLVAALDIPDTVTQLVDQLVAALVPPTPSVGPTAKTVTVEAR